MTITEHGVYDLPADVYHSDPVPAHLGGSLSVSGAKRLLPPSTPAHFRHYIEHGQEPRDYFDFGTVAHAVLLGQDDYVEVDYPDWRSATAKAERQAARDEGLTAILRKDFLICCDMASAVLNDPIAGPAFVEGKAEQSMFWQDDETKVWRRARADWITFDGVLIDYKTAAKAEPREFERTAARLGYDMQADWYVDGYEATGPTGTRAPFLFVVQEKTAPYLVTVVELDDDFRKIGRSRNRRAIDTFVECMNSERWPGYAESIITAAPPRWHALESEEF